MAGRTIHETPALHRYFGEQPIRQFRQEIEDAFQSAFGWGDLFQESSAMIPRMDISETESEIRVQTDLPGFKPEEVNTEINDNYLTLSGTHSEEQKMENKDRRYHRIERRSGSFSRSVLLPCEVNQDDIDAELKEEVLTVKLPKSDQARRQKITVRG